MVVYERNPEATLNEVLAILGYTTTPGVNGKKHICKAGEVVFNGRAVDIWHWLYRTQKLHAADTDAIAENRNEVGGLGESAGNA